MVNLEEILMKNIKSIVSEKIDEEIEQKVNNFKKELEDRKDNYIAEIMKGIRVYHERDIKRTNAYVCKEFGQIYCLDGDFVEKAIEKIGADKLIKLFTYERN